MFQVAFAFRLSRLICLGDLCALTSKCDHLSFTLTFLRITCLCLTLSLQLALCLLDLLNFVEQLLLQPLNLRCSLLQNLIEFLEGFTFTCFLSLQLLFQLIDLLLHLVSSL
jgi:hypothetical protein